MTVLSFLDQPAAEREDDCAYAAEYKAGQLLLALNPLNVSLIRPIPVIVPRQRHFVEVFLLIFEVSPHARIILLHVDVVLLFLNCLLDLGHLQLLDVVLVVVRLILVLHHRSLRIVKTKVALY